MIFGETWLGKENKASQESAQKVRLDMPMYGVDDDFSVSDPEDSLQGNPLALEFATKTRKAIHPHFMEQYMESYRHKEARITKAEKRKEKRPETAQNTKTCYSVFEDMVILTTFEDSRLREKSMNEKIDIVMEDLPYRSFESLRERYRKWLKDFDKTNVERIIKYCDDSYELCESHMIKRKLDTATKRWIVDSFVPIPNLKKPKPSNEAIERDELEGDELEKRKSGEDNKEQINEIGGYEKVLGGANKLNLEKEQSQNSSLDLQLDAPADLTLASSAGRTAQRARLFQSPGYLGKRSPPSPQLAHKVHSLMHAPTAFTLPHQAKTLYNLLKGLAVYHQVPLKSLVAGIDDNRPLSVRALRLQLCSDTVMDRLCPHIPLPK